jgi:hypothetical protein
MEDSARRVHSLPGFFIQETSMRKLNRYSIIYGLISAVALAMVLAAMA